MHLEYNFDTKITSQSTQQKSLHENGVNKVGLTTNVITELYKQQNISIFDK